MGEQSVTIQFTDSITPDRDVLDVVRSISRKFGSIVP
jgi:hypothetical protein